MQATSTTRLCLKGAPATPGDPLAAAGLLGERPLDGIGTRPPRPSACACPPRFGLAGLATERFQTEPSAASPPRPRTGLAGGRGFTLIEVLVAFVIIAFTLAFLAEPRARAVDNGAKAVDLRDVRVAGDTIFRRYIYEIEQVQDGQSGTLDSWYADFVGEQNKTKRDRWKSYRGTLHKTLALAAGTDPTGKAQPLFGSTGEGTTSQPTTSKGSSSAATPATDTATGEQVYQLTLDITVVGDLDDSGQETKVLSLRTVVPIPPNEEDQNK